MASDLAVEGGTIKGVTRKGSRLTVYISPDHDAPLGGPNTFRDLHIQLDGREILDQPLPKNRLGV